MSFSKTSAAGVSSGRLALLLASAVALGPFTIDTYLPAFPSMAEDIGVPIHDISFTISIYIFTAALGQLVGGPVSDRIGRMPVMLAGLFLFVFASFMLALSQTLEWLLAWRAVQAFGGGWTSVVVPAIVRDRCTGKEAARLFSLIGLIMIIAPAIAPTVGSTILTFSDWRSIFVFLGLYGLVAALFLRLGLGWQRVRAGNTQRKSVLKGYLEVLRHPLASRFIVIQSMVFSVMLVFLTHASFIYQEWFGLSAFAFSALFAGNIVIMAMMNLGGRRLLKWLQPVEVVRLGACLQFTAVAMLGLVVMLDAGLPFFVPALMLSVGSLGAVAPNLQASYMHYFESHGGAASALLGAVPMTLTGLISALSAVLSDHTLTPIVSIMLMCGLVSVMLAWSAPRRARQLEARLTAS